MNTDLAVEQDNQQNNDSEPEGVIFEIQRWSGNDGPGIRTVVFFKGCPLRCAWCCNPESWNPAPQIAFFRERCQDCGQCREICPQSIAKLGHDFASSCTACGRCAAICPAGARELIGKRVSAADVLSVIERDRVFYRQSGGGVTFSGGEALAQTNFLQKLAAKCWSKGLPMVLETCGHFSWARSKDILAKMDLIFFDIKHMDPVIHKQLTGRDNRVILRNAIRIAREKLPLVIRVPLIPTVNDSIENITAIATFVSENLDDALGVEILPYHVLGKGKFKSVGLEYQLGHLASPGEADVAKARKVFRDFGIDILHYGSTP